jgi:hypothetical protein
MAAYKASKTQLKSLVALGIEHSQYITYDEAGRLLEQAGWTRDGREEDPYRQPGAAEALDELTAYRNR